MSTAGWEGRTIYHLHALGAAGPHRPGLDRLGSWLDHVVALGAGALLLTPIFASSSHGYDTIDPFRIDPRLGDDADFDRFVAAVHARGLRLLLDGVFNHVGRDFPGFVDASRRGADSPWARWFRFEPDGYACFEGHRELPALDHDEPEVLDWAARVVAHWGARGVDGWRLDAAYAIPRPFLAALRSRIDPAALVFGEIIHGDYAAFVHESGLDSATQYELHKAIWSSLNDANPHELAWALDRHRTFSAAFPPVTFVGNHDVTRIASQLTDPDHLPAALALLFTLPGLPCVYYGDELGWTGVKEHRVGGDDAIRPVLPPLPPVEARPGVWAAHAELVALRAAHPWLTHAALEVVELSGQRIVVEVRGEGVLRTTVDLVGDPAPGPGWAERFRRPHVTVASPLGR